MSDLTKLKDELDELKESESIVVVSKREKGYFVFIGDLETNNSWMITQSELNMLAKLTL